ncbi:Hypp8523 [Branchiostoma lanceolatum]|uniref:Hypp8523 protein n=1 Tax=Branchiostoma lanceolatum TaxID=7740 RepID=A0A8J9Z8W2_BRALA|nr:Hypp8523 [Branchiostoma lanceolatum]
MASEQGPGKTDVRPKKQYIANFLDQATSAVKLKLKHIAEANKRGFTITKVTDPRIGLMVRISNTRIVVNLSLQDICTQCYKENLFGDKTRRKKIEQAVAPYLRPLVHSDFYTSHPYIYPYIIPMCKLNTKIFYVETDWIDADLKLLLGMQVRRPEGSQDPRLKISDVSRWTCSGESLSVVAYANMVTANWLKFEEQEEGVLMSRMTPADLACGLLYMFHKWYKAGAEDMPKPKGEGDLVVVLPVPTVFLLTTSKNYAGLCYVGKEMLRFVDDPEVITTKAMRMTEFVDEKGEKSQRFRLYRPNVTSEEGSFPENTEQLGLLSDALENIRQENDGNVSSTNEVKEEDSEVDTTDEISDAEMLIDLKTTHQEIQELEQQKAKLHNDVRRMIARSYQTDEFIPPEDIKAVQTALEELEELVPDDNTQALMKKAIKYLEQNSKNSGASSDGAGKTRQSPEEYYDASDAINGCTVNLVSTRNPQKNEITNNRVADLSITDLTSCQNDTPVQTDANDCFVEGTTERVGVAKRIQAFESMAGANQGHAYASRRGPPLSVAVVPPIPRGLNDSDESNQSANGETLDSSLSSEEDATVTSWLKRCCSTPMPGRGRARGRVERETPPSIGMERNSLGSIKSINNVSVLPFVQENTSFSNGSLGGNDGENKSQSSANEREDGSASGWKSWLGKTLSGKKVKAQVMSFFGLKHEDTHSASDLTVGIPEELDPHDASIMQNTQASRFTTPNISEPPRPPSTADITKLPTASGGPSAGNTSWEIRYDLDGNVDVVYSEDNRGQLFDSMGNTQKRNRIEHDPNIPRSANKGDMSRERQHCLEGKGDVVCGEDKRGQLLNGTGNTQRRYRIDHNPDVPPFSNGVDKMNRLSSTVRSDFCREKSYYAHKRNAQGLFEFPPIQRIADFQNGGVVTTDEPLSEAIAASLATKWPSVKNALLDEGATGGTDLFLQPTKSEQNKAQRLSQDLTKQVGSHGGATGDGGVAKNEKTKEAAPKKVKTAKKKRSTKIPVFLSAKEAGVTEEATRIASEIAEERPIKTTLCAKLCFLCGALTSPGGATRLRRCNGCGVAMYCSRACQKKHRRQHRPKCQTLLCNKDKFAVYIQL